MQRWEREEGLPVHRLDHAKRGSVYASRRELTAWWESRRRPDSDPASTNAAASAVPREPRSERVTATSAATFWPALSSDARMVVYVSDAGKDGDSPQVWLQQVGGAAIALTSGQRDCAEPTFSADDTRVLFTAVEESTQNVYEIPTLGGPPRLVRRAARNARYSPDGTWLAYIAIGTRDSLRVVPMDGGSERSLATDLVDIACATWSDDGRHLLVVAHPDPSVELDCWIVSLEGGRPLDTGVMRQGRQRGIIVIAPRRVGRRLGFLYRRGAAGCADLAAADFIADLRRDWRTGGHDTGWRLRVLSVGEPRTSGFRRHSRRRQPLVARDRRRHRRRRMARSVA